MTPPLLTFPVQSISSAIQLQFQTNSISSAPLAVTWIHAFAQTISFPFEGLSTSCVSFFILLLVANLWELESSSHVGSHTISSVTVVGMLNGHWLVLQVEPKFCIKNPVNFYLYIPNQVSVTIVNTC